jgi:hypothetical protein
MVKSADNSERVAERIRATLAQPESWPSLDLDALSGLVQWQCFTYGVTSEQKEFDAMQPLYRVFRARASVDVRKETEQAIVEGILKGAPAQSLLPIIGFDTNLSVISSATLDMAVLEQPDEHFGPFAGPRRAFKLVAAGNALPDHTRTGVLMGLVLLGDRRLLPMLEGSWRFLGTEGRTWLTRSTSGYATVALIEFFLSWLEQTEDPENFGGILGTLCRMPAVAEGGMVIDLERVFPATAAGPEGPVRILDKWTFPEFYTRIQPRLERIAAREAGEPKYTPQVARYWMAL